VCDGIFSVFAVLGRKTCLSSYQNNYASAWHCSMNAAELANLSLD
jgi:hypothetical protein